MTTTTETAGETVRELHPFERAGLGTAPFRCTGSGREVYVACQGAPVQPGAACDYCGAGIFEVYRIRSADGREFKVGSTCVGRTGDAKLIKVVKAETRKRQTELRHAREAKRVDEAREFLTRDDVRAALSAKPHANEWRAKQGATLLDWAEWMMENAGTAGQLRVLRAVKALA